jgi:glycosyltransferase involved in cell wall biosynthesis
VRILHLSDRLTDRGGAPRHLLSVVRAQAERGHEVHLAAGEVDTLAERVLAEVHRASGLDARTAAAVDFDALWRAVAPDVMHVHTVMNPTALERAAASGAVFTVQDHRAFCPARGKWTAAGKVCRHTLSRDVCAACFDDAGYFEEMLGLTGARLAALRLSQVVVLSEYMRGELVLAGIPPDRVHVVPPFVDFAAAAAAAPAGPPCVLFVGRLVAAKGPLEAVAAWRLSGVPLPLVVAGTGPLRKHMEAAGAEVLGWVAHDRLPGLLRRARALLMPSRWQEPFGIAGLEALSLGVPVVAWDSGGIREWHPGPLVPWGDVDGLAIALRSAVETRAAMPAGFARDAVMDRLEQIYAMAGATPLPACPPLAPPAL